MVTGASGTSGSAVTVSAQNAMNLGQTATPPPVVPVTPTQQQGSGNQIPETQQIEDMIKTLRQNASASSNGNQFEKLVDLEESQAEPRSRNRKLPHHFSCWMCFGQPQNAMNLGQSDPNSKAWWPKREPKREGEGNVELKLRQKPEDKRTKLELVSVNSKPTDNLFVSGDAPYLSTF